MKFIVDKAETRGYFDHGWLKTFHTFSFADYYNPQRVHFGALRVLNDDTVAPGKGFGMHPHNNMEVVSIPLQGYLRHGDSVKNESTITPGEIQVMSTGAGMFHSEYNASMSEVLKFLQIWIVPKVKNTKPEYHNYDIRPLLKHNELCTFISPEGGKAPAHLLQDAWFSTGTSMVKMLELETDCISTCSTSHTPIPSRRESVLPCTSIFPSSTKIYTPVFFLFIRYVT